MRHLSPLIALALLAPAAGAQQRSQSGPIIHSTGAVYAVPSPDFETARDQEYKVAFEIGSASPSPDRLNVSLNTVARYLNMHAQAGVPADSDPRCGRSPRDGRLGDVGRRCLPGAAWRGESE
jgi:hypothetical protein